VSMVALPPRRAGPLLLLAAAGVAVSWSVERGTVERANRLHRAGDLPAAAGIYADRVAGDSSDPLLRYNLGTTQLRIGLSSASAQLEAGTQASETDLRVRSHYNLGLWNLLRAREAEAADSARVYALASIAEGKSALRLSPGRADARWNLAMAQRMLDSIQSDDGRAGTESVDGSAESDELVRTDEMRELQDESPVGEGPQEGEEETLARSEELLPLTITEADDILGSGHLDASTMIRKLLAFEGRTQRRTRFGRTTPRW
jgi:hypothetical protein